MLSAKWGCAVRDMLPQLLAMGLATLVVGFCLGAVSMVRVRPRRTIDLKVARDEIEEMIAG